MASAALKIDEGTPIPGEEEGQAAATEQTGQRDYDAEARELGWLPKDEWVAAKPNADPNRWVDAETFVKRGDEVMPLLKSQNARLKRELEQIRKDLKQATKHFEGAEERAYKKALADLEEKHKNAVEAGDLKAATEAVKEIRDLKPVSAQPEWREGKSDAEVKQMATKALNEFRKDNLWYDKANLASATETEQLGRIRWDQLVDENIGLTETMPPAEFFEHVTNLLKEEKPELFAKTPRQKPGIAVEGVTAGRPRGTSKSWDNLPQQAKNQFQRFIDRGLLGIKASGDKEKDIAASRAYYAKTFDWEGFKE